jgi:Domain of unknown function DUF29
MGATGKARAPEAAIAASYEGDFHAWAFEQAALMRALAPKTLDVENIAEELEALGRGERRAVVARWRLIIQHLLKWQYQPEKRSRSWIATVSRERRHLRRLENESPSLSARYQELIAEAFRIALGDVVDETDLPRSTFPARCPYAPDDLRDDRFFPGAPASAEFQEIIERLSRLDEDTN